jgi:hypothetical protein
MSSLRRKTRPITAPHCKGIIEPNRMENVSVLAACDVVPTPRPRVLKASTPL